MHMINSECQCRDAGARTDKMDYDSTRGWAVHPLGPHANSLLTCTENRGKTNPGLSDLFTSSSPCNTRVPDSGAPSSEGQKNAPPALFVKELLLRPLSTSPEVACEPTRRVRKRLRRTADGVDRRSRACSSSLLSVSTIGIGLPSAYVSWTKRV